MVTVGKMAANHYFAHETLSVKKQQIKESVFLGQLSKYLYMKLLSSCFRNLLDLLVSAVSCSQLTSGQLKS